MSDLRTAAKQALEFIRWSQFIPSQSEPFPEPPFTAPQVEAALHAALVEDAMQKFTDVNQEIEAELADIKVDSQAIAKLLAARLEGWQAATDALRVALNLTPAQIAHAEAIERNKQPAPQDMMLDELIEPTLYAVLKQYGFSTARSQNGVYYDERSHACYEAWIAGRNSTKPKFSV